MELHVIGSGSSGNAYALTDQKDHTLLIEAGCPFRSVKKALSYNIKNIDGCIITHEHGDHCKYVDEILNQTAIPVYMTNGTKNAIRSNAKRPINTITPSSVSHLGPYTIMPFLLQIKDHTGNLTMTHDAQEPVCFEIHHPEMGLLLFATDTYCLPFRFTRLNHIMIECNYDLALLNQNVQKGNISRARKDRTVTSHMSLENCLSQLNQQDLYLVNEILLIHISKDNGDPERFARTIAQGTNTPT